MGPGLAPGTPFFFPFSGSGVSSAPPTVDGAGVSFDSDILSLPGFEGVMAILGVLMAEGNRERMSGLRRRITLMLFFDDRDGVFIVGVDGNVVAGDMVMDWGYELWWKGMQDRGQRSIDVRPRVCLGAVAVGLPATGVRGGTAGGVAIFASASNSGVQG